MTRFAPRLQRTVERIPRDYPGPGGAIAVLHNGNVIARHTWGWANAERRIPFTAKTLFRMCSITKQFTCALVLDAFSDPSVLDRDVCARLRNLEPPFPTTLHLCHNQSGLRDYWAIAMLLGSPPEAPFGTEEADRIISHQHTTQFAPGIRYSYANQNFRMLSDILQHRTGRSFSELLRTRLFQPLGMETALLAPDTRALPDSTEGYEGTPALGYRPAVNRIHWTGDAGLAASLDDMIAWERAIDATRDDPASLYQRLTQSVSFSDGAPASYGFGLYRRTEFGRTITGHGGGLRGWRSHRLYSQADRISVVVLFNHLADAHAAAFDVLAAALDQERPSPDPEIPPPPWLGCYLDPETGLAVQLEPAKPGQILLRYSYPPEELSLHPDGSAGNGVRLTPAGRALRMQRPQDNLDVLLRPCEPTAPQNIAGTYHCNELESELTITQSNAGLSHAAFSGALGIGRMEELTPVGGDLYCLPCLRALDYSPPGHWTLQFHRDPSGKISSVQLGSWLARGLAYAPVVRS